MLPPDQRSGNGLDYSPLISLTLGLAKTTIFLPLDLDFSLICQANCRCGSTSEVGPTIPDFR